jgi:hypothetical protein
MSAEPDKAGDVQQHPGTPAAGPEDPPGRDETEPEPVPESEHPDIDDEGHMAPSEHEPDED